MKADQKKEVFSLVETALTWYEQLKTHGYRVTYPNVNGKRYELVTYNYAGLFALCNLIHSMHTGKHVNLFKFMLLLERSTMKSEHVNCDYIEALKYKFIRCALQSLRN